MDHTHIVQSRDLSRYADTRASQAVIPELVFHLVQQSVPDATECRIPYGDAVNQPGWDGLVESESGFLGYVPKGRSYWEIGTGTNPQSKANKDFKKRTKKLSDVERDNSSFIFVTPRSSGSGGWGEPEQTEWINKQNNQEWKRILIIDGVKLADWLREFPTLGRWMAKKVGITSSLSGIITPSEHWELILSQGDKKDPPLPPTLFTASRNNACDALEAAFKGESNRLLLFAESEHDVDDFVAAYLATQDEARASEFSNRCLFINEEDAWRSVVLARRSHVLVANPRLGLDSENQDLQTVATSRGHAVVIPLYGALSGGNPEIIKLRSPSRVRIENVLKDAGFSKIRARDLAGIGDGHISALRRHLHGLGTLPPYATWNNARQFAQAGLAGQWNGTNKADKEAMEILLGKDYGEWIETLRTNAIRSDSPLVKRNAKWKFVARGEAWNALGNRITDDDLDRLQQTAIMVLGERDPKFDLPKEERWAAGIHGKSLKHSDFLRKGLAETMALVGSRPEALSHCSVGKAETIAISIVRQLLHKASWDRWASLDSHLPLLAEATPNEFLKAVETALEDLDDTPFHEIFSQEGSGGNYMVGLLWALESLAWNPHYLSWVAVILADIGSIDPGGNWGNRPENSLVNIFLPWHVQTTASFEKRHWAIKTVLEAQSTIGWKLLLALLPHNHGVTYGCHRPTWRDDILRDWKDGVSQREYWKQIKVFAKLAIEHAKEDAEKLSELITRLPDLPKTAQESFLSHLISEKLVKLSEAERFPFWEELQNLARRHRRFADAAWALPEEIVLKIEEAASSLTPIAPELKYQPLFSDRDSVLLEEKGSYVEQQKRVDKFRQDAVKTILEVGGLASVLTFAQNVSVPYEVGRALGIIATKELEDEILPSYLSAETETVNHVVAGFVWARYWELKWTWVDVVLEKGWSVKQKAAFLTLLPFKEEVWSRVFKHLGEQDEGLYWRDVKVHLYEPDCDLTIVINKLLEYERSANALQCVSRTVNDERRFDEALATRTLLAVLDTPLMIKQLDYYEVIELIKRLQESPDVDQETLFKIEWSFLPWLDQFSSGYPVTLESRLASDPAFFAEIIKLVFRSQNPEKEEAEPDEQKQNLADRAYDLLVAWKRCPGTLDDGSFDVNAFNNWINEARRITKVTGHWSVAQIQIGHVLTHSCEDPNELWIHEAVASVLNGRDTEKMRSEFTSELFNQRGVYLHTAGTGERKLAQRNREKADALDAKGFSRFATAMRQFAEVYERQAIYEADFDPFDD